ncbi:unnamed protein product [Caenorhabditis nigoni]
MSTFFQDKFRIVKWYSIEVSFNSRGISFEHRKEIEFPKVYGVCSLESIRSRSAVSGAYKVYEVYDAHDFYDVYILPG